MSDSGLGLDCLTHFNKQHIQVRKDFMDLCDYDPTQYNQRTNENGRIIRDEPNQECMAKILRVIETLTTVARETWYSAILNAKEKGLSVPNEPEKYPIELAYRAISNLLYNTYGESTIRNSVAALIEKGYISRTQETNNSIPVYILNIKFVQNKLKEYREIELKNMGVKSTPNKKRGRPSKRAKLGVENTGRSRENNSQTSKFNSQTSKNNTNNNSNKNFSNNLDKKTTTVSDDTQQSQSSSQNEINLSSLSEQEKFLYSKLRKQYQPIYLAWSPEDRSKYVHWIYSFDDIIPLDITDGVIEELRLLRGVQTSPKMFRDLREWKLEQERRENKHYYADRGFKLWDVHRELQNWKMSLPKDKPATSNQGMDYHEAMRLVDSILGHVKKAGYTNIHAQPSKKDGEQTVDVTWHDGFTIVGIKSLEKWKTIFVNSLIVDEKLPEGFDKQMNEDTKFKDIFKAIAAYKEELNAIPV
jgi:hypothetical protein